MPQRGGTCCAARCWGLEARPSSPQPRQPEIQEETEKAALRLFDSGPKKYSYLRIRATLSRSLCRFLAWRTFLNLSDLLMFWGTSWGFRLPGMA